MGTKSTSVGKSIESYVQSLLDRSTKGANAAETAGYPGESSFTQSYYQGIPSLYMYGDAEQNQALQNMQGLYGAYGEAGDYNKTNFDDIAALYGENGEYDPASFTMADYTTQNIQDRMSPYEELVSDRARSRLKKSYDEARGEREAQAVRAGAFGGSGAAIQEELARRNMLEQMADMDATNLQTAFESGAGLYSKEIADRLAAEQAGEQSRQFGTNTAFAGLEGLLATRQQTAAQEAAAKEAQFKALEGQGTAAQSAAQMAEQKKNMQLANLAAMQSAGQQQETRAMDQRMYPLNIAQMQGNILGSMSGSTTPVQSQQQKTSLGQNILGGITAGAGLLQGLGGVSGVKSMFGFADGGLVMADGGIVDLERYYRENFNA